MIIQKYEATGNDFIMLSEAPKNPEKFARKVCDRHFGIGADGLIYLESSQREDCTMRYFNADGTEAPMCGNGMRCFVRFLKDNALIDKERFTVSTLGGVINVETNAHGVSLTLEKAITKHQSPDVKTQTLTHVPYELIVMDTVYAVHIVTVGTLHGVVFVDCLDEVNILEVGHILSTHAFFPKDININFVEVKNKDEILVTTFERGAGYTLSCGTGSAASAYVAHALEKTNPCVTVQVPGGVLHVDLTHGITLSGPARKIATLILEGVEDHG